jgi:peptide/nickel transport system substrate-binding protein
MKKVLGLFVAMVLVLSAAGVFAEDLIPGEYYNLSDYEAISGKQVPEFKEAPMLADLVQQGKLPPVAERLPKNPVVVTPYEEIGQYGGTWRRTWTGLSDQWGVNKIMHEHLMFFDKTGGSVLPNVVESWEASEDGKEYTFKIREGLKWSDGVPVTTADVMFWYEDVMLNEMVTATVPIWLIAGGEVGKVEAVDDYTFTVKFGVPYTLFPLLMARNGVAGLAFPLPRHYLEQFHAKYASEEELTKMAKEEGYDYWYQLLNAKGAGPVGTPATQASIANPDLPVVHPWILSKESTDTRMIMERNPYYFKVDPEGNQLPYLDKVEFNLVQERQMTILKAIAGEVDMQTRHVSLADYTLLAENMEKGDYKVLQWRQGVGSDVTLYVNQNVQDEALRPIFEDVRFRQALSLALNREEIWQLVYMGLGEPRQASLISGVAFYDPEWETAYAAYDPVQANALLDEMGFTKKGADGFRLRADGETLALTIDFASGVFGPWVDVLEMVKNYLEAVGIKTVIRPLERTLYTARTLSGEIEIGVWMFDRNAAVISDPIRLLGTVSDGPWASLYGVWYNSGRTGGEEPAAGSDIMKIYDTWDQVKVTVDPDEQNKLFQEIINLHKKNLWYIGTVGELPQPVVVKNNFKNVPDGIVWDDPLRSPKNARPEQFFKQ